MGILFIFSLSQDTFATHNFAGHITYRDIGTNTVEITLTTYSDPSVAAVDRCSVDLEIWPSNPTPSGPSWEILDIPRINGPMNVDSLFPSLVTCPGQAMGEYVRGATKRNVYQTTYTFSNAGSYLVRFKDLARYDNINNISNSGNQAFFVESLITVGLSSGPQNSVVISNHQVDHGCVGEPWNFNPGAYELDGDSLDWRFVDPLQYDPPGIPTPITCTGYQNPGNFSTNGPLTIDPQNGFITWDNPTAAGLYTIAYVAREFRNGVLIGRVRFDQNVFIRTCSNQPPMISAVTDTAIIPGDTLRIPFSAWDPDFPTDSVYLQLNTLEIGPSNPVTLTPAATITVTPFGNLPYGNSDTIHGVIEWVTTSALARLRPYQIDLYAHDNKDYAAVFNPSRQQRHHAIRIYVRQPVGVEETTMSELRFDVSPNPTPGEVLIRLPEFDDWDISVWDLTGRQVLEHQGKGEVFELELKGIPKGMYLIRVEGNSRRGLYRTGAERVLVR